MSEPKRISSIDELLEPVKTQARLLMEECKKNGLNVKILETYRTQVRQDYLYEQGRTRPGKIVTQTRSSNHTSRKAFDVIQNIPGKEYDEKVLAQVAKYARPLGLEWGGDWKGFKDSPHFENQSLSPIPPKKDDVSEWAKDAWQYCKEIKLLDGTRPKDNITREELAVVMQRILAMK